MLFFALAIDWELGNLVKRKLVMRPELATKSLPCSPLLDHALRPPRSSDGPFHELNPDIVSSLLEHGANSNQDLIVSAGSDSRYGATSVWNLYPEDL